MSISIPPYQVLQVLNESSSLICLGSAQGTTGEGSSPRTNPYRTLWYVVVVVAEVVVEGGGGNVVAVVREQ